jgi:DNA-binding transcriptional ArsR family regulator
MGSSPVGPNDGADAILPDDVPVAMPDLPPQLAITTPEQVKAISDPTRSRILGIIQNQPATAKQIADRLGQPPGTIGHHLQMLEEAGLAQVVARRLVRGIVAKYYTRTARIFAFDLPPDVRGHISGSLDIITTARNELADAVAAAPDGDERLDASLLHARLSAERAEAFNQRLKALIDDFLGEPPDPEGEIYSLAIAFFVAPPYLQIEPTGSAGATQRPASESAAPSPDAPDTPS